MWCLCENQRKSTRKKILAVQNLFWTSKIIVGRPKLFLICLLKCSYVNTLACEAAAQQLVLVITLSLEVLEELFAGFGLTSSAAAGAAGAADVAAPAVCILSCTSRGARCAPHYNYVINTYSRSSSISSISS